MDSGGDVWLRRAVVLIIVTVSSIIALATIGAAIVHPYISVDAPPSILENWGGLIIGFYFGTFVGLLKDWLGEKVTGTDAADAADKAAEGQNQRRSQNDPA